MLEFREIDINDMEAYKLITDWSNDPKIEKYVKVNFEEGPYAKREYSSLHNDANNPRAPKKVQYMIILDERPIGEVSLMIDPPHLAKKEAGSGWLGIMIGDLAVQGKGIGKKTMDFIETVARNLGLHRIELGVFEYNKNAIKLYEKCGYKHFTTFKDFTYCEDRWYDDLRYEKDL